MTFKIRDYGTDLEEFRRTRNPEHFVISNPAWTNVTEDFAKRLGINAPKMIRVPTPFINATAYGGGKLYISDGMIKLLESDTHGSMSKSLQSVVAHEMGHFKYHVAPDKIGKLIAIRTSWATLPLAAVLGLALYEDANADVPNHKFLTNRDKKILKHIDGTIEKTLADEKKEIEIQNGNQDYLEWLKINLYNARYAVAGALGFTAGALLTRNTMNAMELQADRVAVELMGEAESFKAFESVFPQAKKAVWDAHNSFPEPKNFVERMERFYEREVRHFLRDLINSHPSMGERVANAEAHLARLKQTGHPIEVVPGPAR